MVCTWDLSPGCCDDLDGLDPDVALAIEDAAVDILRGLRPQYGLCEVEVWPCAADCPQGGPWYPTRIDGEWFNVGCGCQHACSCGRVDAIILDGPVHSIVAIDDGISAPPEDKVRVFDRRLVVRIDGERWPACQHLGGDGWTVTYLQGSEPPASGQMAAKVLACELAKQCKGEPCRLPFNFTQITRQGVTISKQSLDVMLAAGFTGLVEVDMFLSATDPSRRMVKVSSPDIERPKVLTWPV